MLKLSLNKFAITKKSYWFFLSQIIIAMDEAKRMEFTDIFSAWDCLTKLASDAIFKGLPSSAQILSKSH